jgi:hypothetical protein
MTPSQPRGTPPQPARPDRIVRIAITQAAFGAIAKNARVGSVNFENATNEKGERLIWLDRAVVTG